MAVEKTPATITVWDVENDCSIEVTVDEARAGMVRFARSLGPGTPACGEWERKALALRSA